MRKQGWWLCVVLLAVSWHAEGQTWKEKYFAAQQQLEQEKYTEAFALADESLKGYLAEGSPNVENHAAILRLLSSISYIQQELTRGLKFADDEIKLRDTKKDTTYAIALTNKAQFEEALGDFAAAVQNLVAARAILAAVYPESHPAVVSCTLQLASAAYLMDDFAHAREWLTPVLVIADKKGILDDELLQGYYYAGMIDLETGKADAATIAFTRASSKAKEGGMTESPTYPMILYGLGRASQDLHRYAEAETHFQIAQATYEKIAGKEGESYFVIVGARLVNLHYMDQRTSAEDLAKAMRATKEGNVAYGKAAASLGFYYHGRGDQARAESFYREALAGQDRRTRSSQYLYAETNLNLAGLLADQSRFTEALERIKESQAIISGIGGTESPLYLSVLNLTGEVQLQAGQLAPAEAAFREALILWNKLPARPDDPHTVMINGLGEVAWRKGQYRRADSLFLDVLKPYDGGKAKDRNYTVALNNLAASRQSEGKFNEALTLARRSAVVTRSLYGATSLAFGYALENQGLMEIRLGQLAVAKARLDSAVYIFELGAGKESLEYANALMSLARYHQVTGDYTRAEPYLKSARDIIRRKKGDKSPEFALCQNSMALLYQTLGNYRDAEAALSDAKAILEKVKGKLDPEYATVVQNLAALYQLEGSLDKAEPLQREALEIDRKTLGESHPQYTITLQNLATLFQKLGRREEARGMLEKVLEANGNHFGRKHPSYITTLSNLAVLYQDLGNFSLSESTWKQSVDLRKEVLGEDHPDYARSLYGLAGVYHAQGQWAKAKQFYEPVVEKYQKQVEAYFPAMSEKEKSAFYAKIKPVFDAYQDFFVQYLNAFPAERSSTLGKLYDLQLSTKAILLNSTNKVRARILASGDPALQELFRNWLNTKEQLVRYYSGSQDERARMGIQPSLLEERANEFEKQLSARSDVFRSQIEKERVHWTDVRGALVDGEVAVEVLRIKRKYITDSVYYVGLLLQKASTAPEMVVWPLGAQLEGRRFKFHRNTIKYHVNDTISYRYYWKPLETKIKAGSTVFLSCDGVFNKVNFNSLYESGDKHFVIDAYRLHQLSNTRELIGRANAKTSGNMASLFGFADFNLGETDVVTHSTKRNLARSLGFEGESIPVLPATEKEVDGIASLLKEKAWTANNFKRAQASEENLKKLDNPKLIHIATHGFFLSDVDLGDEITELAQNPLFRSGVLFAGAGVDREASKSLEDGVLTAYEAMNLNLDQTELVVLSACETGLGEVRNGEGVYGLQRAFLVAGANTVLMSLWQVDDVATQQLMNSFYGFWLSGTEKHDAFRKAQLEMKEKYQIPYFWGAFVLIGN